MSFNKFLKQNLFILVIWLFIQPYAEAKNYYFSSSGNDSNTGISEDSPWRTFHNLRKISLKPGDKILLHRGDVFHGNILIAYSGTEKNPICIDAYGNGSLPVLDGSVKLDNPMKANKGLVGFLCEDSIYSVFGDREDYSLARYPDNGFLTIDQGAKDYLLDQELNFSENELINATIRVRTVNWQYEIRKIQKAETRKIYFDSLLWYPCLNGYGYFLENNIAFLSQKGEWIYKNGELWIMPCNNENESVYAVVKESGIELMPGISNIDIQNIELRNFANSGVLINKGSRIIRVMGCKLHHIGIYGISAGVNSSHLRICKNSIYDVWGRGVSAIEITDSEINDNTVFRIGLKAAYGVDGVNNGIGIFLGNTEFRKPEYSYISKNCVIRNNRIDSTGYIGLRMDGVNNLAEYNVVTNTLLKMNDGAAIYCWAENSDYTHHNIIRHNIVRNVFGSNEATPANELYANGIYVDNKCHHIQVDSNIIINAFGGILINDEAHHNSIMGNTTYDVQYGLLFSEYCCKGSLLNNTAAANTFFVANRNQNAVFFESRISDVFYPGQIDSNFYAGVFQPYYFRSLNYKEGVRTIKEYTLQSWRESKSMDQHSSDFFFGSIHGKNFWESKILVNDSFVIKAVSLDSDNEYFDCLGKKVSDTILIPPFSCVILVYDASL